MLPRSTRAFPLPLLVLAGLLGCDDDETQRPESADRRAAKEQAGEGAAGSEQPPPEGGSEAPEGHGAAFEWTERPTLAAIPDVPVGGVVQGAPFDVESVYFEPRFGQWALVLSEADLEAPTDPPPAGARSLALTELPAHLGEGEHRRDMREVGGSLWRIRPERGGELTTWSAPHAFVLDIDEWEADPWDADGPLFQEAGRASGRIAVVHRASDGLGRAWIAGRFDDAVIRYMGRPGWLDEATPAPEPAPEQQP